MGYISFQLRGIGAWNSNLGLSKSPFHSRSQGISINRAAKQDKTFSGPQSSSYQAPKVWLNG